MNWLKRLIHQDSNIFNITSSKEIDQPSIKHSAFAGTEIVAIGGGKGGVGKSLLTSNLGIVLSKQGCKVLLVDADLGAANLHTFLGVDGGAFSLTGFLKGEHESITHIISKTSIPGLDLISGAMDARDAADLDGAKIGKLQGALRGVEYDYVLLDIGPGTSSNILDLFLTADEGIMVTTPEPTSIENTYRFLKCLFLQRLKKIISTQENGQLKFLLHRLLGEQQGGRARTIADVIARLKEIDAEQGKILEIVMEKTALFIVINQARRRGDQDIGLLMNRACHDFFGIDIGHLGTVQYEDCVVDSIRSRMPLGIYHSESQAARSMQSIAKKLIQKRSERIYNRSQVSFA
jgi:flagellar biosynthesis protein FlhG